MSRPTVFISYSHQDEAWKDALVKQLRVLQLQEVLGVWDDRHIQAGEDWYQKIQEAIAAASVAILLISADFLNSPFILGKEIPALLKRREKEGLQLVPVIVKPCPWRYVKWLARLEVRPKDGTPLSAGDEHQRDIDLLDIVDEVASFLGHFKSVDASSIRHLFGGIPPLLPYLPNRGEQDFRLGQTLKRIKVHPSRPIVFVIHGEEVQHENFLERLQMESLPRLLCLGPEQAIPLHTLNWPTSSQNEAEFHEELRKNLGEKLLGRDATHEELIRYIAGHPCPVLLHTYLLSQNWTQYGQKGVENFLSFWKHWQGLSTDHGLMIFLSIKYQTTEHRLRLLKRRRDRMLNQQIEETVKTLAHMEFKYLVFEVLPKLDCIRQLETEQWVDSNEIRCFFQRCCKSEEELAHLKTMLRREIRILHKRSSCISMEELARQLESTLNDILSRFIARKESSI